jgi:iron complex transport system substrate-binding protein
MAPNQLRFWFAWDLRKKFVGVTRHCNYPPQALVKQQIGTFWQPDVEAVLNARPTLVIAEAFEQHRQLAEQLARNGCRTLTVQIETIGQLYDGILAIGQAVNATSRRRRWSII